MEEITKSEEKSGVDASSISRSKYDDAVRVVLSTGQASASYLQRRSSRLLPRRAADRDQEANGIVGPSQGSKPATSSSAPRTIVGQQADLETHVGID